MKFLVFDTETTGFIQKNSPLEDQPKIIQFAGIIGEYKDGKYTEIERINQYFDPMEPIPFAASQVHHIYDIDVKGKPKISERIESIMEKINSVDIIVAHNIEYDESMLKIELERIKKPYLFAANNLYCTMKNTVDYCQIEGNGNRFKYPKLGELHKKLFGEYFRGAHDAIVDVEATVKCFIELLDKNIIQVELEEQKEMTLFG